MQETMFSRSPSGDFPCIDTGTYVHPTAVIIGKVEIGKDCFIGPGAVIRADEPESSIIIADRCNVQDRVVIHALEHTSVLIEECTSLAHGCIVHGPCKIGKGCFIGFNSIVFKSEIEEKCLIKHLAVVEDVSIFPKKVVESGQSIVCDDDARELKYISEKEKEFTERIVKANLELIKGYIKNRE